MNLSNDLKHFLNESKNCVCVCINKSEVVTDWEVVFLNSEIINKFSIIHEIKLPTSLRLLAPEIIGVKEIEMGENAFINNVKNSSRKFISSKVFGELVIDFTFLKIDNFLVFEIQNITNSIMAENDLLLTASLLNEVYEIAEMYPFEINLSTGLIKTTFNLHSFFDEYDKNKIYTIVDLHTLLTHQAKEESNQNIEKLKGNSQSFKVERMITTASGLEKHVEVLGKSIIQNDKSVKLIGTFRDITKRKVEEKKLKKAEQNIIDNANLIKYAHDYYDIGTFTINKHSKKITSDYNFTQLFESSKPMSEVTLEMLQTLCSSPEDVIDSNNRINEAFNLFKPFTKERKLITEAGNVKYIEFNFLPLVEEGICDNLFCIFRNVTIRNERELKISQSEQFLKEKDTTVKVAHDLLQIGTYQLNIKTGKALLSNNVKIMFEVPLHDTESDIAFYNESLILEKGEKTSQEIIDECIKSKSSYIITRKIRTISGKIIYVENAGQPIFNEAGVPLKLVGTFRNITKQKEEELLLHNNKQLIEYAHVTLKMGAYNLDLSTNIINTDFNFKDFFELDNATNTITVCEYLSFLSDEDRLDTPQSISKVIAEKIICGKIRKVISKNGNIKYLEVFAQALFDDDGIKCSKIIGTFRDVTLPQLQNIKLQEADDAIKNNSELLNRAHKLLDMGTYVMDMQTGIITSDINPLLLFELPDSHGDFTITDYKKMLAPDDEQKFFNDLSEAENTGNKYATERKIITAKGNIKYIEILGMPVMDAFGKLIKVEGTIRNITDRKNKEIFIQQTELKLSETNKMLNEAHMQLRMGSYIVDLASKQITSTLDIKELYELPDEKNDFTLDDYFKYISKDELEESKVIFKKLIESGVSFSRERKITTAKANEKFVEITGNPFYENGAITKISGTFRDITFRKKLEIKLLNTEIKLLEAENLLRIGTFDFDLINNTIEHSIELTKLLEIKDLQPIKTVAEFVSFVHDDDKINVVEYIQALIKGENLTDTVQRKMISQNGNIKYLEIVSKITSDNNQAIKLSGTFRDITQQYENDIALKRSEEKFRELFENTPSMYFIIDSDHNISSVNQFGADYLGFKKDEIIGKSVSELFYNEDKLIATEHLNKLMNNDDNFLQWELRKRKKSGEIIWVKETARIIKSTNNNVFFLIVCEDITAEIQNRLLVNRKQDELQKAKEKAEVAMLEKQQFTSIMSHEIRTPLNAVIGMTNVLLMENPRENQVSELNTLKFAAENLLVLVNDILDFSKIESGKIQLEKISFDIHQLVHNIKSSYKFKADEKGIFINSIIDKDVPSIIIGDPMRISQILNNLVSNAVKFTENGFVEISLRKIVTVIESEIKVRFEISDTGIGIPTTKLKTIFESFSQANIDTTRKYGGTGLGLTITQKLIHLYKSEIDLQSEVGKGSTFSFDIVFTLPLTDSVEKNSFFNSERSKMNEIKKVLLVEDNEINRIVTVKFLKRWNLDVETAINGKDAIHKLENNNFDLVLMDIHMPEMNGIEATQLIRKHENLALRNIPIIALTAAAVDNERETLIEDGLSDYVSKPFNPAELHDKIFKYFTN